MGKFSFFWNRNNDKEAIFNFQQNVVTNEQAVEANQPADPYEAIKQAERDKAMLGDEKTGTLLMKYPSLHPFIPAMASVNRTTKLISKKYALIMWLDWQILDCLVELGMHPQDYENRAPELIQGLEMQYNGIISDAHEGWKGHILTEQKKTIATEFKKGK